MSRAQLVAKLWEDLGGAFTEAGITNADTAGNLKGPVDNALLALGVAFGDLATATVTDADITRAIALANYYGYVAILQRVAHKAGSTSASVGAPSVSKSENHAEYIRALERLRDAAKADAEALTPGTGWAFADLDLGIFAEAG